jgi:hypothetical protein
MRKATLLICTFALSLTAWGQSRQSKNYSPSSTSSSTSTWSTYGGQSREFEVYLSRAQIHSYKLAGNSYTDINIYGAYNVIYKDNIQIGGEGGLMSVPDGTSNKTLLAAMGVLTYNMDHDLSNSFFGNVGLGLYPASETNRLDFSSKFSFMFNAGKRVPLWSRASYKPFVRFMKRGDMDMEIYIEALAFSFLF